MFDINFYMSTYHITEKIINGEKLNKDLIIEELEKYRNKSPMIYNIETTNACNMRCKMCPRTTMMTRKIETLNKDNFIKIIDQIKPFSNEEWTRWINFVQTTYGIFENDMNENHFFLYIIPKIIQLHGYGDPLLDTNMADYVELLSNRSLYSYFSCNPANIDISKTKNMFSNGLNYIKYSIESVDDTLHKQIRGQSSDFTKSYTNICELLNIKEKYGYKTTIIITMLDLNLKNQHLEYKKLKKMFDGLDVYIYLKSEDQQWYRKDYHSTGSVHWLEFCKHPWMSMTIKSNGDVVMCMEDYNNEIILGNINSDTLYNIWNNKKYQQFREDHFNLESNIKCINNCDMCLIGDFFNGTK